MYRKTTTILLFAVLLLSLGCGQAEREKKLAAREKQVMEQQQELILKANELALKEDQLHKLAKSLDSAHVIEDSLKVKFPQLPGKWNVSMVCSVATCSGSAVGDTKTEQWTFSISGSSVIAQAFTKNVLSRVYVGQYKDGLLQLTAQSADTTLNSNTQINVFLRQMNDSLTLGGKRSIIRPDCQIIYNLTMKKQ
jgi:hypothetical protein